MRHYLMLDKDDITNVCGVISRKDAINELDLNEGQFANFVSLGKIFRDKYILVEDWEGDTKRRAEALALKEARKKNKTVKPETKLILETEHGRKYFARSDGVIYVLYKKGTTKVLTGTVKTHRSNDIVVIKMGDTNYVAKNLMAKLFIESYKDGDVVLLKDGDIRNYAVDNLIVIDKGLYAKRTGAMARSKPVGLFENGKLIRKWSSARKAAKSLYCSYQMINDYCNGETKEKEFDVRWL